MTLKLKTKKKNSHSVTGKTTVTRWNRKSKKKKKFSWCQADAMCFETCKVVMYNRIIVHEGTGGRGCLVKCSCLCITWFHFRMNLFCRNKRIANSLIYSCWCFCFFSSQKPQERNALLMKSKTLSLPPSESQNRVGPSHCPHSTQPPLSLWLSSHLSPLFLLQQYKKTVAPHPMTLSPCCSSTGD